MYSGLQEKILEYNDFIRDIVEDVPLNVAVDIEEQYYFFYNRCKQWLHLSRDIKSKYANKRPKRM